MNASSCLAMLRTCSARWHASLAGVALLASCLMAGAEVGSATIGLPFTRAYPLNEIGASRGALLGFDHLGRIAVISGQSYSILNDNTWTDRVGDRLRTPELAKVSWGGQERYYYGSLADWGTVTLGADDRFYTTSLRPAEYPQWVRSTNFTQIVPLPGGALFGGYNGMVYEEEGSGRQVFVEVPELIRIFEMDSRVFVSTHVAGLLELDLENFSTRQISPEVVDEVAVLGPERAVMSTLQERLLEFDGKELRPWRNPLGPHVEHGSVSALCALAGGGVAIAVNGQGVFVATAEGDLQVAITTLEYHRVFDLAAREEGVLWLATETSLHKVLYNSSLSVVDQRSGIIVAWPTIAEWSGGTSIASNGLLYDMIPDESGLAYRFEQVSDHPPSGVWAMAGSPERGMLVGNAGGVFSRGADAVFRQVMVGLDTSGLVMTDSGICYVIGKDEIAALRWNGETWEEFAERVPGVGFPSVIHEVHGSVWIELGLNLVARIWMEGDSLRTRVFDDFPWPEPEWVNIGSIGNRVIMSGPGEERVFFDEEKGRFVEAPALQRMLSEAPYTVRRIGEDARGVLWGAHLHGIVTRDPAGADEWISPPFGVFGDRYPRLHLVGDGEVWVSTQLALYHADRKRAGRAERDLQPRLVAVTDGRTGQRIFLSKSPGSSLERIPYSQNHLVFTYFAGGYASLEPLSYRFSVQGPGDEWTIQGADSLLTLPNLWEGDYALEAQLFEGDRAIGAPVVTRWRIEPPWFRTGAAYTLYVLLGVLGIYAMRQVALRRAKQKHAFLEALVRERTEELRATMEKLTEEARNSATLAERNRLAGEIHDSVQQGLSGLILQLDATLKLPNLPPDVQSRLAVARRMVSFTRHEVQQAVWDLESLLLENEDLSEALQTIADLVSSGSPRIEVDVEGGHGDFNSSAKHHLLRIAQEAITNAVRHSGASRIHVVLRHSEAASVLEVRDDGSGFSPEAVFANGPGHFGLRGLRSRTAKIDGRLEILSEPGGGTTVRIAVPRALSLSS